MWIEQFPVPAFRVALQMINEMGWEFYFMPTAADMRVDGLQTDEAGRVSCLSPMERQGPSKKSSCNRVLILFLQSTLETVKRES